MKNIFLHRIILILSILVCITASSIDVYSAFAPDDTEIVTITDEDLSYYREQFSVKTIDKVSESYKYHYFFSFDVSEDGNIVLLFDDATVVVFDNNGRVKHILKFDEDILNTRSRSASIKWSGENLELTLGYDVSCLFTTDGDILDIWQYKTELTNIPNPSELTVGEYTYEMESSNLFIRYTGGGNYDKLIKHTGSADRRILFESEKHIPGEAILLIVFVIVFHLTVGCVGISIIISHKKRQKQKHRGRKHRGTQGTVLCVRTGKHRGRF